MGKSKLFIQKEYTIRLVAHDALHKLFYELIKRWLFVEGRKVNDSEISVRTI